MNASSGCNMAMSGMAACLRALLVWGVLLLGSSHLRGMCSNYQHYQICQVCRVRKVGDEEQLPREGVQDFLERVIPGIQIACKGGLTLGNHPSGATQDSGSSRREARCLLDTHPGAGSPTVDLRQKFRDIVVESDQRVLAIVVGSNDNQVLKSRLRIPNVVTWFRQQIDEIISLGGFEIAVVSSILPRIEDWELGIVDRKDSTNEALRIDFKNKRSSPNKHGNACRVLFMDFRRSLTSRKVGVSDHCPKRGGDIAHLNGDIMGIWLERMRCTVEGVRQGKRRSHPGTQKEPAKKKIKI